MKNFLIIFFLFCAHNTLAQKDQSAWKGTIVLTFDDACESHYKIVAPILKQYGFSATFFVCEFPDGNFGDSTKYLSWHQIKKLSDMGFEIGNHTWHHSNINSISVDSFSHELSYIENKCQSLGIPKPVNFAYPAYVIDSTKLPFLLAHGYLTARSGGDRAYDLSNDDPMFVPSFTIKDNDSNYFYHAIAEAAGNKITILTIHGVPDNLHPWVNTPVEVFKRYMKFLYDHHYQVVSMREIEKKEFLDARINLDAVSKTTISKNIYGHFAEHLGRCIYDGFYKDGKIRMDIVDALKKIHVPVLRWPGGCFADQYHWIDGVGTKEDRPRTVNTTWGMVTEDNSFGTHEFLQLCELIGCEPYIAGNVGTGTPQEMENWIEYLNYDGNSTLASLRMTNGHAQSFHVSYWGIGNESWGCGGEMTPEYYSNEYKRYASFCTDYPGTTLRKIVSGANADDYSWTETCMKNIPVGDIWGIGLHYYTLTNGWNHKGSAINFSEEQYFNSLKNCLRMNELIDKHSAILDKYDSQKNVALVVDEWGIWKDAEPGTNPAFLYQQNSLRDALIAASTLNIFNNHCERVKMANLAQTVNVLQALVLTNADSMSLTPTYYVFDLYKVHQNAKWIPIKIQSPNYDYNYQSMPALNASASVDSNGVMHISMVNLDPRNEIPITINLNEIKNLKITGKILSSEKFNDVNTFSNPDKVIIHSFSDFKKDGKKLTVNMPSKSIVVVELK